MNHQLCNRWLLFYIVRLANHEYSSELACFQCHATLGIATLSLRGLTNNSTGYGHVPKLFTARNNCVSAFWLVLWVE